VTSSSSSRQVPPVVMVRVLRGDVRDNVIRNRRLLKSTKYSIAEDLTQLNMEVLNRLKNSDSMQKTWTWNGHARALLRNGKKVQVEPFQLIEDAQQLG